jgi:IS30 family transposase
MLGAMDEVRRSEQQAHKSKALHLGERVLMIPETRQNEDQKQRVSELCKEYPQTGWAFRMVQALDIVYASNNIFTARKRFDDLYRWLRKSCLEPMKRTALTLRKHGEVYYAHPYSTWERGSRENGNRIILRRFVPKGADIGTLTATELQRMEDWVDNYPRKILCDKSANEFAACANW